MELVNTFKRSESEIVREALSNLQHSHVEHYEAAGAEFTHTALEDLFNLVATAIEQRDLEGVIAFADELAEQRFSSGFDISEVQAAFNALETAMWRRVLAAEEPGDLPESIGLLSTVFGVAKDALACRYVSLASQRDIPSMDLSAQFRGSTT
jgi:hypothetical protein